MRLYLITSPVVHGDNLAFNKTGVQEVIRSVFLPWYNAYRFLVQNAIRHEAETGSSFRPAEVIFWFHPWVSITYNHFSIVPYCLPPLPWTAASSNGGWQATLQ